MRNYSTDPNSPGCPTSAAYKPTHVYELHVLTGGGPIQKPVQTQAEWIQSPQPDMGYAEMDLRVALAETCLPKTKLPTTIKQANLKLSLTGKAWSKELMTKTFFAGQAKFRKFTFQSDIHHWLGGFVLSTSPIDGMTRAVTATLTAPAVDDQSSSLSVDGKGEVTASSTSTVEGATAQVSLSTDQPFTIVFTFSPRPVKGEYKQTDFEGELEVELSVTYNSSALEGDKQTTAVATDPGMQTVADQHKPESWFENKVVSHAPVIASGAAVGAVTIFFREAIADATTALGDVTFAVAAWAAP